MANKVEVRITGKNDSAAAFADVERSLDRLKQGLEAIGFGLSVGEIAEQIRGVAEHFDSLAKSAEKTGVGVEKLQELQYAAKMADLPAEALDIAMARLAKNVVLAASGQGQAAAAFQRLGISLTDASGKIRPLDDIIEQLGEKFPKLQNGTEKMGAAMEIFGRAGNVMVPFLNHMSESTEEARRLGIVMGKDVVEAGASFNDNLKTLETTLGAVRNQIVGPVLSSLSSYSRELIEVSKQSDAKNFTGIGQALLGTVATVDALVTGLQMMYLRLKDIGELAAVVGASAANPGAAGQLFSQYLENRKQRSSEYDQLNDKFWNRMGALYNPKPLVIPGTTGGSGGGGTGGSGSSAEPHTDGMEQAFSRMEALLKDLAKANGETAESVARAWDAKAEELRRIFAKFPELGKQFGGLEQALERAGKEAVLAQQAKDAKALTDQLEAANKAYADLVGKQGLPTLTATPAAVPTLHTDMAGAELDRYYADRNAQAELAEKLMKDSLTPAQQYAIELDKIDKLYVSGQINEQAYAVALADLRLRFDQTAQVVEQMGYGMGAAFGSFFQTLQQGGGAAQAFTSFADSLVRDMERIVEQMLAMWAVQKMMNLFFPAAMNLGGPALEPSGGTGILPGMTPAAMPHFASGGFLPAGRMAMVGEHGPEPVLFGANATILPNSVLGGGKPNVNVQVVNQGMPKNATAGDPQWNDRMKQWHIQLHLEDKVNNGPLSRGQSGF